MHCVRLLHVVVDGFGCNAVGGVAQSQLLLGSANGLVGLEERAERVFHADTYVPDVEVLVNRRKVVGERSGQVVGCYDGYLGQEFALAQLELLFSHLHVDGRLLQNGRKIGCFGLQQLLRIEVVVYGFKIHVGHDVDVGESERVAKLVVCDALLVFQASLAESERLHLQLVSCHVVLQCHALLLS